MISTSLPADQHILADRTDKTDLNPSLVQMSGRKMKRPFYPDRPRYPEREPFYAIRFVRLLMNTSAVQEIGQGAVLLLVAIAHTEDAARYRRAVTFYDPQLVMILGMKSWGALDRARRAAISAGWLHYLPGGKGRAGKYWTMIPDHAQGLGDYAIDEGGHSTETTERSTATENETDCDRGVNESEAVVHPIGGDHGGGNESQTRHNGGETGGLSTLSQIPIPDPKEESCSEPLNAASEPPPKSISEVVRGSPPKMKSIAEPQNGSPRPPPVVEDPVVMSIPCVGRGPGEWPLRKSKLDEYAESFPGIDVLNECRQARQWAIDNPTKRKTFNGVAAFLTRWLGKSQNRGANQNGFKAGRSYQSSSDPTRIRSNGASQYDGIV